MKEYSNFMNQKKDLEVNERKLQTIHTMVNK